MLCESTSDATFVSAVYGVLDPRSGRFVYSNCGHNPPLLLRPGKPTERLETGGTALGIMDDVEFETGEITIAPGDTLAFYTDGVIEVSDENGVEYGLGRLEEDLQEVSGLPSREMIQIIMDRTRAYSGARAYSDDFTLVIVKRQAF